MNNSKTTIMFLGNGRCFHTMDWFHSAQKYSPSNPPTLITDLIDGESFSKLITPSDRVEKLQILDRVLFKKQSRAGNVWRNLVKMLALPLQILKLRKLLRRYENPVIHAHSMYYIVLARFSGCKYVATPQGSELLVRPYHSILYRMFAKLGLANASEIVVDSVAMANSATELFGRQAGIIQNGIDVDGIVALQAATTAQQTAGFRKHIVSLRAIAPNYQIDRIIKARNETSADLAIQFCYPFVEAEYKSLVWERLGENDKDLGRLSRPDLHRLLLNTRLVLSVPKSDSSPRSVYEAIFCGCFVCVTRVDWVNHLPPCMAERVFVADLSSDTWFRNALEFVAANIHKRYVPSSQALEMFDQKQSMAKYYQDVYPKAMKASTTSASHASSKLRLDSCGQGPLR